MTGQDQENTTLYASTKTRNNSVFKCKSLILVYVYNDQLYFDQYVFSNTYVDV